MIRLCTLGCQIGALAVVAAGAPAQDSDAELLERVAWLAGCWRLEHGARITDEQWMPPRGGTMLGMSRTVVGDSTREYEHVRLHVERSQLVYTASPSGQRPTAFTSVAVSDSLVAFANPAHDFPQRIVYRRVGADSLVARIEGERDGRSRGVSFPMRRVRCSAERSP